MTELKTTYKHHLYYCTSIVAEDKPGVTKYFHPWSHSTTERFAFEDAESANTSQKSMSNSIRGRP